MRIRQAESAKKRRQVAKGILAEAFVPNALLFRRAPLHRRSLLIVRDGFLLEHWGDSGGNLS